MTQEKCPKCSVIVDPGSTECLKCGIVFEKYEAKLKKEKQRQRDLAEKKRREKKEQLEQGEPAHPLYLSAKLKPVAMCI